MTETKRPKAHSSAAERELDKVEKQFEAFDQEVKSMTLDRMKEAKQADEMAAPISVKDLSRSNDIYIKPERTIGSREIFNEKFRSDYEYAKEYVPFQAANNEISGEAIEMWIKPFPGCPAEFWKIPVNKPIWGPRYVAEQIKRCSYHRLTMQQTVTGADDKGQYYGSLAVANTVQRLDAMPVSQKRSVFMGKSTF